MASMDPVERAIRSTADKGEFLARPVVPSSKVESYKAMLAANGTPQANRWVATTAGSLQ